MGRVTDRDTLIGMRIDGHRDRNEHRVVHWDQNSDGHKEKKGMKMVMGIKMETQAFAENRWYDRDENWDNNWGCEKEE